MINPGYMYQYYSWWWYCSLRLRSGRKSCGWFSYGGLKITEDFPTCTSGADTKTGLHIFIKTRQSLDSLRGKTSYRQIFWNREAARLNAVMIPRGWLHVSESHWEVGRKFREGFSPIVILAPPRVQDPPTWIQPEGSFASTPLVAPFYLHGLALIICPVKCGMK